MVWGRAGIPQVNCSVEAAVDWDRVHAVNSWVRLTTYSPVGCMLVGTNNNTLVLPRACGNEPHRRYNLHDRTKTFDFAYSSPRLKPDMKNNYAAHAVKTRGAVHGRAPALSKTNHRGNAHLVHERSRPLYAGMNFLNTPAPRDGYCTGEACVQKQ